MQKMQQMYTLDSGTSSTSIKNGSNYYIDWSDVCKIPKQFRFSGQWLDDIRGLDNQFAPKEEDRDGFFW